METTDIGPLLQEVSQVISDLLQPDQAYVCLWSHAGWQPQHLHFVVQPSCEHLKNISDKPGPFLQAAIFQTGEVLNQAAVEQFCERARAAFKKI